MPTLNILGLQFDLGPPKYVEGHTCNAQEAAALQQTFGENLRNNNAKAIKEVIEKAGGAEFVTPEMHAELLQMLVEKAGKYEFYTSPQRTTDPVDSLAEKLAWNIARDALKKQPGFKLKEVTDEEKARHISAVLEKNPRIREFAEKQIRDQQKMLRSAQA